MRPKDTYLELAKTAEHAAADLSTRLGIPIDEIEVVRARAQVDGWRVILGVNSRSRIYVYEAGSDGTPHLQSSDEGDGGHDFVPPPGIET